MSPAILLSLALAISAASGCGDSGSAVGDGLPSFPYPDGGVSDAGRQSRSDGVAPGERDVSLPDSARNDVPSAPAAPDAPVDARPVIDVAQADISEQDTALPLEVGEAICPASESDVGSLCRATPWNGCSPDGFPASFRLSTFRTAPGTPRYLGAHGDTFRGLSRCLCKPMPPASLESASWGVRG